MSKFDKLVDFIKGRELVANATAFEFIADEANPIPEWVQLLPLTGFTGRDGRGPFHYLFADIVQAFQANGLDLPIDLDHQSLTAGDKVGPAGMAVGWVKELAMRADGLWGRVEWTGLGAGLLADKAYKYLSPVFMAGKDGEITKLVGAGLVPYPNLELTPVMHSQEITDEAIAKLIFETTNEKGAEMDLNELATLLGLQINAETPLTAEQIAEALKGLQTQLAEANTELETLKTAQAEATATVEANAQLVAGKQTELEAMATKLAEKTSALEAMASKLAEVDGELAVFKAEQAEKELDTKLASLVEAGKLLPGAVANAKAIAQKAGVEAVEALIANQDFSHLTQKGKNGSNDAEDVSPAVAEALKLAGISVEQYLKNSAK